MPDPDAPEAEAPAETAVPEAAPEASAQPEAAAADPKAERIAEIIRSHLRDSPLSRMDGAWNHLQSQLGAIAADILKEA